MKVNEIRIGNWVYLISKNKWYQIESGHDIDEGIDSNDFEPILITEEWLLKFGCEKAKRGFVIDRFRLTYNEQYKFWYVVDDSTLSYITKVEFVHEWQNVYFVLNGNELTIKINKP
jgi:hypothetical protein